MEIEVRPVTAAERRAANDAMRTALLFGPATDADWETTAASWEDQLALGAWEQGACVGHAGAFAFATTVPGGARLPTAGLTRVGILPTHTRHGTFRRLITEVLSACRDRGDVLASLRASEAVLYGRFGFGLAGHTAALRIDRRRAALHAPVSDRPGRTRMLPADRAMEVLPSLHDRIGRARAIDRPAWMWRRHLGSLLDGSGASRWIVLHLDAQGEPDGWVDYETVRSPGPGFAGTATAKVRDLVGATPEVERALWHHLITVDLVDTIEADVRPLDDPIRRSVADSRSVDVREIFDEQWLRLLDVPAALRARRYGPGTVTIAVTDALFPANAGTYRIADGTVTRLAGAPSSPTGTAPRTGTGTDTDTATATATATATDTDTGAGAGTTGDLGPDITADITADVAALGAAYLGGTSWQELAAAGRVLLHDAGAPARADAAFATRPLPFCGSFF